jgi:hypothetical protein
VFGLQGLAVEQNEGVTDVLPMLAGSHQEKAVSG